MFQKRLVGFLSCLLILLGFSISGALAGNVLFISAMDVDTASGDEALRTFIESLGRTVTLYDDDSRSVPVLRSHRRKDSCDD